jgi:ribosome-associated protein
MTVPALLRVTPQITIPGRELDFSFVRSSGPGGQNVNKVASKAVLRWNVLQSGAISDEVRARLLARERRRINERGELILTSQRYRDQPKNIDDCLAKMRAIVTVAARRPRARKKTKPTKASREARLSQKRAIADKKQARRRPIDQE